MYTNIIFIIMYFDNTTSTYRLQRHLRDGLKLQRSLTLSLELPKLFGSTGRKAHQCKKELEILDQPSTTTKAAVPLH